MTRKFCTIAISILLASPAFGASESREQKRVALLRQVIPPLVRLVDETLDLRQISIAGARCSGSVLGMP